MFVEVSFALILPYFIGGALWPRIFTVSEHAQWYLSRSIALPSYRCFDTISKCQTIDPLNLLIMLAMDDLVLIFFSALTTYSRRSVILYNAASCSLLF